MTHMNHVESLSDDLQLFVKKPRPQLQTAAPPPPPFSLPPMKNLSSNSFFFIFFFPIALRLSKCQLLCSDVIGSAASAGGQDRR